MIFYSPPSAQVLQPFASKTVGEKSLFTRVHGSEIVTIAAGDSHVFEFVVPYDECKITCAEVVKDVTHKTDLEVHHAIAGKLNQFGFGVNMGEIIYKRESSYDSDLFKDLILKVKVTNETSSSAKFGVNFILHELK